jgi:hypothetical protein
LIFGILEQ